MKFVGYMRVSGDAQVDQGGFPRQEDAIKAFAAAHNLPLSAIVREEGVSGTVEGEDRPEMAKLLMSEIDGIIIEKLDRLSRELLVQEQFIKKARQLEIAVYTAEFSRLENVASKDLTPSQTMTRQVTGSFAEMAKSEMVLRTRKGRERVKALTGRCEGRKPFGEGKSIHEKRVLHALIEMREAGIKSRFIGNALAQQGLGNPNTGKPYTRNFINRLIARHCKNTP